MVEEENIFYSLKICFNHIDTSQEKKTSHWRGGNYTWHLRQKTRIYTRACFDDINMIQID